VDGTGTDPNTLYFKTSGGLIEDKNYLHVQGSPASSWNVTHSLNKYPAITIFDSSGNQVEGDVTYSSLNQVVLTFSAAFAGTATFN